MYVRVYLYTMFIIFMFIIYLIFQWGFVRFGKIRDCLISCKTCKPSAFMMQFNAVLSTTNFKSNFARCFGFGQYLLTLLSPSSSYRSSVMFKVFVFCWIFNVYKIHIYHNLFKYSCLTYLKRVSHQSSS